MAYKRFSKFLKEGSDYTYDWKIATRDHNNAVDNHPDLPKLRAAREESKAALRAKQDAEIAGMKERGERITQHVYERQAKERAQDHETYEATKLEDRLHAEHDPLDFHTTRAASELLNTARAAAYKKMDAMQAGKTPGPGTAPASENWVEDTIRSHFRNFNAHPKWGSSVPFERFEGHVRGALRDMREG